MLHLGRIHYDHALRAADDSTLSNLTGLNPLFVVHEFMRKRVKKARKGIVSTMRSF